MDLKEFTKQTLIQIVEGTKEADKQIAEYGAHIHTQTNNGVYGISYKVTDVEFDVAITTTESEEVNGGAGLKVASFVNIGGESESKTENQTISRIKYTLPLILGRK